MADEGDLSPKARYFFERPANPLPVPQQPAVGSVRQPAVGSAGAAARRQKLVCNTWGKVTVTDRIMEKNKPFQFTGAACL